MFFASLHREQARRRRLFAACVSPRVLAGLEGRPAAKDAEASARTMTFLVCRIRRFSDIVDAFAGDASGLAAWVRRIMTPLAAAVLATDGTIDRAASGELVAFFNAPLEEGEHAGRACACALLLEQAAKDVDRSLRQEAEASNSAVPAVAIGIGLATGLAVAADLGTDEWPHYGAVGPSLSRASELERVSQHYGVSTLADSATCTLAETKFPLLKVDIVDLTAQRLAIFALVGNAAARASPRFLALKTFHEHLFDLWRQRQWQKARLVIEQARALSAANPQLYDFYLARIAALEAEPPPPAWDAVAERAHASS